MKEDRLKAIVTMAKKGTKFEKRNAITILRKLCKKHNLVFEELMEKDENLQEFIFEYRGKLPKQVAHQIYFKIIGGEYVSTNEYCIFLKTTKEKYIEFEVAFNAYRRTYKKEQKKLAERHKQEKKVFQDAFIQKHNLFGDPSDEMKERRKKKAKKITDQELKDIELACRMAGEMEEEANIYKQLK